MNPLPRVAVFGAYGHTARFVIDELCRRGWQPILSGRDVDRLAALGARFPGLEQRPASIDDPASLDRALKGAVAVINCAGPFLDTATPIVEAALRACVHYLDLSAEQQAVLGVFDAFNGPAEAAGVTLMPGMAFYGGLADLLATAALAEWPDADSVDIAVALDSWHPTRGTRLTGARNHHRRMVFAGGHLTELADPAPTRDWQFAAPFSVQNMVALPLSEIITISRHLRCSEVHSWMNLLPLQELRDPATPPPRPTNEAGHSDQIFEIDVAVRRGSQLRRASAQGRDIYAISAPLVVEALQRIADGRSKFDRGAVAAGAAFNARDFLSSLRGVHIQLEQ